MTPTPTLGLLPHPGLLPPHEVFPPADYQFRLKLARAEPSDFFRPWHPDATLLAQRQACLDSVPERHLLFLPDAEPLLDETLELARSWLPIPSADSALLALGTALEPDLLFLVRTPTGPRLVAGAVCFPSSWAPEEKLGRSVLEIHEVVPGLNPQLGGAIDTFLDRLRPGIAWMRANWGLAASPELNQHPARALPRLSSPVDAGRVWVRIEHQALLALPRTSGLVFGIRLEVFPILALQARPELARNLARALRSMPDALARYKGIAEIRQDLADRLETTGPA